MTAITNTGIHAAAATAAPTTAAATTAAGQSWTSWAANSWLATKICSLGRAILSGMKYLWQNLPPFTWQNALIGGGSAVVGGLVCLACQRFWGSEETVDGSQPSAEGTQPPQPREVSNS